MTSINIYYLDTGGILFFLVWKFKLAIKNSKVNVDVQKEALSLEKKINNIQVGFILMIFSSIVVV